MGESFTVNSDKFDTTGSINYNYNYCFHRLPCGVCMRTNSICPMSEQSIQPTWGPNTITTNTGTTIGTEYINTGTVTADTKILSKENT